MTNHVFCYGSLRPDDDSGMAWTQDAVAGMRAQPATVAGAKLYHDRYAALVFDDDDPRATSPSMDGEEIDGKRSQVVVGWVLTTQAPRLFAQKLKDFDSIEGYKERDPETSLYQRRIADVRLGDPKQTQGGEAIGEEGSIVKAFVYHKPDCNREHHISSGDWLRRGTQ